MKEFRIYILNADNINISGYDIEEWNLYQEQHNKLTDDAKEFINEVERIGSVYSLFGFQNAFNIDEEIELNDWVFITNHY